jgi:hypothetical protein
MQASEEYPSIGFIRNQASSLYSTPVGRGNTQKAKTETSGSRLQAIISDNLTSSLFLLFHQCFECLGRQCSGLVGLDGRGEFL